MNESLQTSVQATLQPILLVVNKLVYGTRPFSTCRWMWRLLNDSQLRELGLVSMGEIATIRAKTTGLYKGRGRPPIRISLEQVELMREAKFTWKEISGALLISRSTLWRHSFRNYSDQELEDMLDSTVPKHWVANNEWIFRNTHSTKKDNGYVTVY